MAFLGRCHAFVWLRNDERLRRRLRVGQPGAAPSPTGFPCRARPTSWMIRSFASGAAPPPRSPTRRRPTFRMTDVYPVISSSMRCPVIDCDGKCSGHAWTLPKRGSGSACRRSTRTAVQPSATIAMRVQVSNPTGVRHRLKPLAAAGRVRCERSSVRLRVDHCLANWTRDLRPVRVTLTERRALYRYCWAVRRGGARRQTEFGGSNLPCGIMPRLSSFGYFGVPNARGRACA